MTVRPPTQPATGSQISADSELFSFIIDKDLDVHLSVSAIITVTVTVLILAFIAYRLRTFWQRRGQDFEIDEASFGVGDQTIKLKPNNVDRQIAYQIWVELSTRKIGLPIDLEDDVIAEIYDSWYSFFAVTRELIKDVPVSKFRRADTEKIIRLSIEVLNNGIRPHLTKWQARFRRWYERELMSDARIDAAPQDVQRKYPSYDDLSADMIKVNKQLILYRKRMHDLVTSD